MGHRQKSRITQGIFWCLGLFSEVPSSLYASSGKNQTVSLLGDFLAMAPVQTETQSVLHVISVRGLGSGRAQKYMEIFAKDTGGALKRIQSFALHPEVVGFDICPDPGNSRRQEILLIGTEGIYRPGQSQPFIRRETTLAHPRDDAFVRVRICFDLFKGEPRALVIPLIRGLDVMRFKKKDDYVLDTHINIHADARYLWPLLRGSHSPVQRLAVRFEYPDVHAVDFNADSYVDLCLTSSESVRCFFQNGALGFKSNLPLREFTVKALTAAEKKDTSKRIETKLVDVTGDNKPELIVAKSTWNLSDIGVSLFFYHQDTQELFQPKPFQVIERSGYFGFQEYWDYDGDGLVDMTAPVATTSWTDIAAAYLTKKVQLEFILYKNKGGQFQEPPLSLHNLNYPIDFKNWASLLGCLPLWNVKMGQGGPGVLFFPMAKNIELRTITKELGISEKIHWETSVDIGGDVQTLDLDQDQQQELVIAYPRDAKRSAQLLFIDTPDFKNF